MQKACRRQLIEKKEKFKIYSDIGNVLKNGIMRIFLKHFKF